ncbi:hypothetical protein H2241_21065 [Pantoea ananatis]|uniref:hypothetical protein n=1 Tax=Pantoea ananas TaxID=553 RepID=UPI001589B0CF|nr:hypothetical protein [Pantoea ananatis]MBA4823430.1 hypothetical protein [Pantoea ananatis]QKV88061.1 hypothetical protein FOB88_13460 [Pantoea ananatis]
MLLQDDEKGHVIIGEAALHLALAGKEINVASLMNELRSMAAYHCSDDRLSKISEARTWLKPFIRPVTSMQSVPHLQIFAGLNEEIN